VRRKERKKMVKKTMLLNKSDEKNAMSSCGSDMNIVL
jgi:hypothetical protein